MKLKRKLGDRYDGYRCKNIDPFFFLIPHIMKSRADSQVYFSDTIDITNLEAFVREHSTTDVLGLKTYHVVIASMVRMISQRPYLNRFIMGGKIFARNNVTISMSIKRGSAQGMSADSETTVIKPEFELSDTLLEIVDRFNEQVDANRTVVDENSTDRLAKILGALPSGLLRFVINFLTWLDNRGHMPKIINKLSPFHTSMFITNMGSLGIKPIYHHIYNFGSTSVFIAIGKKRTILEYDDNGKASKHKVIDIKVVADERICDGCYYAYSMRMLSKLLKNPEVLLTKPEQIIIDDGIVLKGRTVEF